MLKKQILSNQLLMLSLHFGNNCFRTSIRIKIICFQRISIKNMYRRHIQECLKARKVKMGQIIKVSKRFHLEKIQNKVLVLELFFQEQLNLSKN